MIDLGSSVVRPEGVTRTLLLSETVFFAAIDPEGRVLIWNRGAEAILGWPESEVVGRPLPAILPEHAALFASLRARVLSGEVIEGYRMTHRRKDGSKVDLVLSLRPMARREGRYHAILALGSRPDEAGTGLRNAQLDALELEILEHRLPTHFLLNSLHNLGMVVRKGERGTAVKLVAELGDMLRHILATNPGDEVSLRDELAFVDRYVKIEGIRRSRPITAYIRAVPDTLEIAVPALVLQPLVENALRHGLDVMREDPWLRVEGRRSGGRLHIRIDDNGRGLPEDWHARDRKGLGLKIVQARLARMYGPDHHLGISDRSGGGVSVLLDLPCRRAQVDRSRR